MQGGFADRGLLASTVPGSTDATHSLLVGFVACVGW